MTVTRKLINCPLCLGAASFCQEEGCTGCHYIACTKCRAIFDLSLTVDPQNEIEDLDYLQMQVADKWNERV